MGQNTRKLASALSMATLIITAVLLLLWVNSNFYWLDFHVTTANGVWRAGVGEWDIYVTHQATESACIPKESLVASVGSFGILMHRTGIHNPTWWFSYDAYPKGEHPPYWWYTWRVPLWLPVMLFAAFPVSRWGGKRTRKRATMADAGGEHGCPSQ